VIQNCAHDSVCACSIDDVCDAVLHRYAEARQIADGIAERAVASIAATAAPGPARAVVVNPSTRSRSGVVEVRIPGEGEIEGMQLVRSSPGDSVAEGINRAMCLVMARQTLDMWKDIASADVEIGDDGVLTVTIVRDHDLPLRPHTGPLYAEVKAHADADPDAPARFVLRRSPLRTFLARTAEIPPLGWQTFEPAPLDVAPVTAVEEDGTITISNGLVTVALPLAGPDAGTWSVDGTPGFGRLVDDGDVGDTYNWCPPSADTVVDQPAEVTVELTSGGPVVATATIRAVHRLPTRAVGGERTVAAAGAEDVATTTTVELRAGERLVRVAVEVDNRVRDHRLRAWFPLPEPAATSRAECAFAVVERGLTAEGGPTETGLPTFPSRRFVQAGGLTVLHDGLLEYELVDIDAAAGTASQLALTLLRCTGMLSQGPMATRPLPAGPLLPLEGSQVQGRRTLRYALAVGPDVDPYALADDAWVPLPVGRVRGPRPADAPHRGDGFDVRGAEVSALLRQGGRLTMRVFNPSDADTLVEVPGRRGWLVDLRGRSLGPFDGSFPLGPWRIATAVLDT
jgi:mannosylglycerate hydrolase